MRDRARRDRGRLRAGGRALLAVLRRHRAEEECRPHDPGLPGERRRRAAGHRRQEGLEVRRRAEAALRRPHPLPGAGGAGDPPAAQGHAAGLRALPPAGEPDPRRPRGAVPLALRGLRPAGAGGDAARARRSSPPTPPPCRRWWAMPRSPSTPTTWRRWCGRSRRWTAIRSCGRGWPRPARAAPPSSARSATPRGWNRSMAGLACVPIDRWPRRRPWTTTAPLAAAAE